MSCPPPRTAISHRFVLVGGVAVFYKERFHYGVELVGNRRKIIDKTLDIRFKDLC
jgi:hypothetical protein